MGCSTSPTHSAPQPKASGDKKAAPLHNEAEDLQPRIANLLSSASPAKEIFIYYSLELGTEANLKPPK